MNRFRIFSLSIMAPAVTLCSLLCPLHAEEVLVTDHIALSTTWKAENTYNLQQQIFVLPGTSLTIEPGTVIANETFVGGGGLLAVCQGAQIYAQGTREAPVIMTSKNDVSTWDLDPSHPTGRDPKTGTWRAACNEWGNLSLLGSAFISGDNVPWPDASNQVPMEGLMPRYPNDPAILYGGGNDEDNSGSIYYLSLRYTGKVIGLANQLSSLALGGVGRDTDIHHIDIMNNVDDGIEFWGGVVKIKYFNVWNVGDDSIDIDRGWRGKGQFGLIVQGYSQDEQQGSGVGDNGFEMNGSQPLGWLPLTEACFYNCTVVGQPGDTGFGGDHGTYWRDEAHVQFRNCIFMDLGHQLIEQTGYAAWPNDPWYIPTLPDQGGLESPGFEAEITDSVLFRNLHAQAYQNAALIGLAVYPPDPLNRNAEPPPFPADAPITEIVRGPLIYVGGLLEMYPVLFLDPRPQNDALMSANCCAPENGFYSPVWYRGAFAPGENWLYGWTATYAYGMTPQDGPTTLIADKGAVDDNMGGTVHFWLKAGEANAGNPYLLVAGVSGTSPGTPLPGGMVLPLKWDWVSDLVLPYNNIAFFFDFLGTLDSNGEAWARFEWPGYPNSAGLVFYFACCAQDPVEGFNFVSNPLEVEVRSL